MKNNFNKVYDRLREQHQRNDWEINESRLRQQAWMINDRIMFESTLSKSSASSAAAGSGAGGGGRRNVTIESFPSVTAQSYIITWLDSGDDVWKFVVYNYDSGQLSDTYITDLTGTDWNLNGKNRTVQYKGFTLDFDRNVGVGRKIYFINAEGTVVGEKTLDTVIVDYTERATSYHGLLSGVRTLYHFDGDNVRTHTFNAASIDVNDGGGEDVMKDGSIVVESPDNDSSYYVARPNGELIDVNQYLVGGGDSFRTDYNTDFIFKTFTQSKINIVSKEGDLVNTFDILPFNVVNTTESALYGENCAAYWLDNDGDTGLIISYDGDTNQFVTLTFSNAPDSNVTYHRRSWQEGASSFGKNLILTTFDSVATDNIGFITSNFKLWYLPKSATQFNHVDLSSIGTMSYVTGNEQFDTLRSFSFGENPIFMYAPEGGEIIVSFLEEAGYSTQSTGILAASCSNIYGHNIGSHSFAVFDVGSNRIWQMYDSSSKVAETQTSATYSWGDGATRVSLRNGTLAVIDSIDTSNSFIYTTVIGLTSGPTGLGKIYNIGDYGNNTGLAYEYQVISQYVPGEELNEYVEGFYILSKAGLSEYTEFFPGISPSSTYIVDDYCIGSETISFRFQDMITNYHRYQVYNSSTLEVIHDWDPGNNQTVYQSYDNRFYVEYDDGAGNVEIRLVSLLGAEILNIQTTNFDRESNDTNDNSNG